MKWLRLSEQRIKYANKQTHRSRAATNSNDIALAVKEFIAILVFLLHMTFIQIDAICMVRAPSMVVDDQKFSPPPLTAAKFENGSLLVPFPVPAALEITG